MKTSALAFLALVFSGLLRAQEIRSGETVSGRLFTAKVDLAPFAAGVDGIWRTRVPPGTRFDQLWVNGRLAQRARQPNAGYLYVRDPARPANAAFITDDASALAPLARASAAEISNVLARVYHSWDTEPIKLVEVDANRGYVRLAGPVYRPAFMSASNVRCSRYTLENARRFLDAPGEWFLDETAGELLYLPQPGETPETACAAYADRSQLLRLDGVRDVTFDRCVFAYSGHLFAPKFHPHQAAAYLGAAVEITGATNVVFRNCTFRHLTEHALWLGAFCRDCRIENCTFEDLGAGAVRAGPVRWNAKARNEAVGIVLENSRLVRGGRVFPESCGVLFTHVAGSRIAGNEVADWHYTGISLGWTWGNTTKTANRGNLIAQNHVWNIAQHVLGDVGGIYHLGYDPGTVIAENFVHDVWAYDYNPSGSHGIYLDEGSSDLRVVSNRVFRCRGDFTLHYGLRSVVEGNVFGPVPKGNRIWSVGRPDSSSLTYTNNVETAEDDPRFAGAPSAPIYPPTPEPPKRKIPTEYADDFESLAVGDSVPPMFGAKCQIRVTDRTAKSGLKSLEFVDRQGLPWKFAPHLFACFAEPEGKFEISFALRVEAWHAMAFELRNYSRATAAGLGFLTGPGLAITDGKVRVFGVGEKREIGTVAENEWFVCRFRVTRTNGISSTCAFELVKADGSRLSAEGDCPRDFTGPTWAGFMSNADWETRFQVDDFKFKCD